MQICFHKYRINNDKTKTEEYEKEIVDVEDGNIPRMGEQVCIDETLFLVIGVVWFIKEKLYSIRINIWEHKG